MDGEYDDDDDLLFFPFSMFFCKILCHAPCTLVPTINITVFIKKRCLKNPFKITNTRTHTRVVVVRKDNVYNHKNYFSLHRN